LRDDVIGYDCPIPSVVDIVRPDPAPLIAVLRRSLRPNWSTTIGALLLATTASLGAQEPVTRARWAPQVRLQNDAFNFWLQPGKRPDEEYTNGARFAAETMRPPRHTRWLGGRRQPVCADAPRVNGPHAGSCLTATLSLTQDMYTPNLERPPYSYDGWRNERPYAAWLAYGVEVRRISARAMRTTSVAVGVTGTPALGQLTQSIAHALTSSFTTKATGWETQIGFEPGIIAGMRQSLLALRAGDMRGLAMDIAPTIGASLGSAFTAADAGVGARLGWNLSHPWDVRTRRQRARLELFVSASARQEYVARHVSLDGTLFGTSRRVERVPGVHEYEFGAAARYRTLQVGYRAITRSREYRTGPAQHTVGSMEAGFVFVP
jgi:hypothetical protein